MIYWWTGKPGAGKTLHAIEQLLDFKAKGRLVYACNVREFQYEKTGVQRMTPEEFRNWMTFLPDGAVALVDECYEHGMLPKRSPGAAVPPHVQELAKHRHRGIDFIFVCQSPDKQCDAFVHDLIEWHTHVRRMFGSNIVQLRQFDRFEPHAEKATPISNKRGPLLGRKKSVGTYNSTEMDTTEKRIPWYFYAFIVGVPLTLGTMYYIFGTMGTRLTGEAHASPAVGAQAGVANGAPATVAATRPVALTPAQLVELLTPRIPSQPWTAPAYDGKLQISSEPPRIFCSLAQPGETSHGEWRENSKCSCVTEQGTRYRLEMKACATLAMDGQYEPYFDEDSGQRQVDGNSQVSMLRNEQRRDAQLEGIGEKGKFARYGEFRDEPHGPDKYEVSDF